MLVLFASKRQEGKRIEDFDLRFFIARDWRKRIEPPINYA